MRSRGDHFDGLTADEKVVEQAIRALLPNGCGVRSTSLYTWESVNLARRLWPLSKKNFLYKLEIEEEHIRFRGDLNWFSEAVQAVTRGESPVRAVGDYCSGALAGHPWTEPRVEILAFQAKVMSKLS
jgi:hypothetical protein